VAGYSGTPLPKKLGIKEGHRLTLLGAPADFLDTLGELPPGVQIAKKIGKAPSDVIVAFVKSKADFLAVFPKAQDNLQKTGGLWFAWPKKSSGVKTDLTEDVIRDHALAAGLVDNKVCAIDETWSGLRIVVRVKDR
jgi:hypothetical protein